MSNNSDSGTGVIGLLGIAFIVLKLCDVIQWSWWYVTMPFCGSMLFGILVIVILLLLKQIRKSNK